MLVHKTFLRIINFCSLLYVLFCFQNKSYAQTTPGANFFKEDTLHTINIISADSDFLLHVCQISGTDSTILAPTVIIDGVAIDSVGFRERSGATYDEHKPSMKMDFNFWKQGGKYDGLKSFLLRNCLTDPSYLREYISCKLNRAFGGNGLRTTYANVFLNNIYVGLYIAVEQVNNEYCKYKFGNGSGDLYKAEYGDMSYEPSIIASGYASYGGILKQYELKTNVALQDSSKLIQMLSAMLFRGTSATNIDTLDAYWNFDKYLIYLAANHLTDLHDFWWHNYYLYHNTNGDNKWNFIIWDQDLSFWFPCQIKEIDSTVLNNSLVHCGVFYSLNYTERYYKYVSNLFYQYLQPKKLYPITDSLINVLRPWALIDTNKYSMHDPSNSTYNIDSAYLTNNWYQGFKPYNDVNYSCVHSFLMGKGFDYELKKIILPDTTHIVPVNAIPFHPAIEVKNNQYYVTDSLWFRMQIYHQGNLSYQDSTFFNDLYADSTQQINFANQFTNIDTGWYQVHCSLLNCPDDLQANNSLIDSFYVTLQNTGVQSTDEFSAFKVYPNPANIYLIVKANNIFKSIAIYDCVGRKLICNNLTGAYYSKINLESLTTGSYFIEMEFNNNTKQVQRFIKSNKE